MVDYKVQSEHPEFDHRVVEVSDHDLVDDLGREEIAAAIAEEIRGRERPNIIGIYGSWGSGKSYLLDLTIRKLSQLNQSGKLYVLVCPFNPWQYEMEGDLAPGLIRALSTMEKFNPQLKDSEPYKAIARDMLDALLEIGPSLVPGGQVLATALSQVVRTAIKSTAEQGKVSASASLQSVVDQIKSKMQALVNAILGAAYKTDPDKDYRLVVFVDDLDRCSPENLVRLFEWLKVHLDVEGCTYVLALDHVAAARAIVGEYKKYLGEKQDLAYGFRYLEKLVEREYELGPAQRVEQMAVRRVYGRSTTYARLSDAARELSGGDFPGISGMDGILTLRALRAPRTMLKIIYKFKRSLEVIVSPNAGELRRRLPAAYPYWTLLLIAMYYRLDPDYLDEFTKGRGTIYQLMLSPKSIPSEKWGDDPLREFCWYADNFGASTGSSMQLPTLETLSWLATIIRENTFDPTSLPA